MCRHSLGRSLRSIPLSEDNGGVADGAYALIRSVPPEPIPSLRRYRARIRPATLFELAGEVLVPVIGLCCWSRYYIIVIPSRRMAVSEKISQYEHYMIGASAT